MLKSIIVDDELVAAFVVVESQHEVKYIVKPT